MGFSLHSDGVCVYVSVIHACECQFSYVLPPLFGCVQLCQHCSLSPSICVFVCFCLGFKVSVSVCVSICPSESETVFPGLKGQLSTVFLSGSCPVKLRVKQTVLIFPHIYGWRYKSVPKNETDSQTASNRTQTS